MADDREILKEIWEGRIPVQFTLAPDEVYTIDTPEPYYLLVPRLTYFPIVTEKVHKHFQKHVNPEYEENEMWLEFNRQPLRWHYPVGLLYDLLAYGQDLPWAVTVHFDNFPEDELLHCLCKDAVESHYMSSVKEADALKHRCNVINSMQRKDHKQLWLGLQNDKFEQFWAINRKLMEKNGDDGFRFIPFRLYQPDGPFIQKLYRPVTESGDATTLGDLIEAILPDSLDGENVCQKFGSCDEYLMSKQWGAEQLQTRLGCTDLCETRYPCKMVSWNGPGTCKLHSQICSFRQVYGAAGQGLLLELHHNDQDFPCSALNYKFCSAQASCVHEKSTKRIISQKAPNVYSCMLSCYKKNTCQSLLYTPNTQTCELWKSTCIQTMTKSSSTHYVERTALTASCFPDPNTGSPNEIEHLAVLANM